MVEKYIRLEFLSVEIASYLKCWKLLKISHEWIYHYINSDKQGDGNIHTYLCGKRKIANIVVAYVRTKAYVIERVFKSFLISSINADVTVTGKSMP